jgi:hypothetical protein
MDTKKAARMARFGSDGAPASNKRPAGVMEGAEQAAKQPRLGEIADAEEALEEPAAEAADELPEGSENPEGQ